MNLFYHSVEKNALIYGYTSLLSFYHLLWKAADKLHQA